MGQKPSSQSGNTPPIPPSSTELSKRVSFTVSNDDASQAQLRNKKTSSMHKRYGSATAPPPSPTPMLNKTPRLPVPELADTCARFIETVEPLLTAADLEETKKSVAAFLENEGPDLQTELKRVDTEVNHADSNYVEKWWTRSYLEGNDPIVFNVNPYFILADGADPAVKSRQCVQAASLLESSLRFALSVRTNTLTPDMARTTPLDMSQYPFLFNSARIPSPPLVSPTPTSTGEDTTIKGKNVSTNKTRVDTMSHCFEAKIDNSHVVVLCRNQMFYFDVFTKDGTSIALSHAQLVQQLERIVEHAAERERSCGSSPPVGAFTTLPRDEWGTHRVHLSSTHPDNKRILRVIDRAILVLCLDHAAPSSLKEEVQTALCGLPLPQNVDLPANDVDRKEASCFNRWYDKLQLIVCSNGRAMVNFEHTAVDGHTVLRMAGDVYADTLVGFARSISGKERVRAALHSFSAPSARELKEIKEEETAANRLRGRGNKSETSGDQDDEGETTSAGTKDSCPTGRKSSSNSPTKRKNSLRSKLRMSDKQSSSGGKGKEGGANIKAKHVKQTTPIRRLDFELDPALQSDLRNAQSKLLKMIRKYDNDAMEFADYGKELIVKRGMSPDAFVQVAMLAAYYKVVCVDLKEISTDLLPNTYESVMTKRYSHGRTEAGRTATMEALKFVRAFYDVDSTCNGMDEYTACMTLITLLQDATKAHSKMTARCAGGMGVDRHLFALKSLWADTHPDEPLPAVFASPGYDVLGTTMLSTSNCGNPSLCFFGFGPVSANGAGVGYLIKNHCIQFSFSSRHVKSEVYLRALGEFLSRVTNLAASAANGNTSASDSEAFVAEPRQRSASLHVGTKI